MLSIIRNDNYVVVVLDSGVVLQSLECDDELFEKLQEASDEEITTLLNPEIKETIKEIEESTEVLNKVNKSCILTIKDGTIYWEGINKLSLPKEFAMKILDAEEANDNGLLETYANFWTLMGLNPDPLCRENLFKWLLKWGMTISKSGLLVGYRNVDTYDDNAYHKIYTDHHSHSYRIKIGEMVTMPREKCDCDSHISCSRGLHIAGEAWLNKGYFGDTGLVCLINPADIVAVPFDDEEYGKLRCCAYMPIATCEYDEYGRVIPYYTEDGFDAPYIKKILYDGIQSTEDNPKYSITIPDIPGVSRQSVKESILAIARACMKY